MIFEVHSAGIEPGKLNPIVVEAMRETGIDISGNPTKSVWDFLEAGTSFSFVVTVCDEASAERCPIFPGVTRRAYTGVFLTRGDCKEHPPRISKRPERYETR